MRHGQGVFLFKKLCAMGGACLSAFLWKEGNTAMALWVAVSVILMLIEALANLISANFKE